MSNKTLLLEVLCEEIPATMQLKASLELVALIMNELNQVLSNHEIKPKHFVTPRRIGLILENFPSKIELSPKEIKGPKTTSSKEVIDGFLKKYKVDNLSQLEDRNGVFFLHQSPEEDHLKIIGSVIEKALSSLVWPKSMSWGEHTITWVRPIHKILCILDDQIIPLTFGHIKSSNQTKGHRFISPHEITIFNAKEYVDKMRSNFVEIFFEERRKIIENSLKSKLIDAQLIKDEKLLDEVTGLVEWPVCFIGSIRPEFLNLPKEVLIATLRFHQKSFLYTKQDGSIAPYFGITSNIIADDEGKILIEGNERVVSARLFDAQFFFEKDKEKTLESRIESLRSISFHEKIGDMYEKSIRNKELAVKISKAIQAETGLVERAADLMKCDLTTEMVNEFPELQGIIGYYYAIYDKEDPSVAQAIMEHYMPKGRNDSIPTSPISICLALAEKLDTLTQMFKNNIRPTGSKDPFALRRAAIGVLLICQANNLSIDFYKLGITKEVIDFINERSIS